LLHVIVEKFLFRKPSLYIVFLVCLIAVVLSLNQRRRLCCLYALVTLQTASWVGPTRSTA